MPNETPKDPYRIGPIEPLRAEIGQVVVNHSTCESAIHSLFLTILGKAGLSDRATRVLVKSQNMKASSMAKTILALLRDGYIGLDDEYLVRIPEAIRGYQKLSGLRNEVAHWQWAVTDGHKGTLFNDLQALDPKNPQTTEHTLTTLREISVGLVAAAVVLNLCATAIASGFQQLWADTALKDIDNRLNELRAKVAALPDPAAEEMPQ